MENIKNAVLDYLEAYPPALQLFRQFMRVGEVYMIGGILREYKDKGYIEELRDADFIVNVKNKKLWSDILEIYQPKINSFGGYKFFCSGFFIDVWEAEQTWAYRENKIEFNAKNYCATLPQTVFLNMDAIVYDLTKAKWYDTIYREAKKTGVLDVVLEDNPHIKLNILRAMILRERYEMNYSEKLKMIIKRQQMQSDNFIEELLQIQENRYHKEILRKEVIRNELKVL